MSTAARARTAQRGRPAFMDCPSAVDSTGAVGGRTPRQRKKASAACSTSMPRPSPPCAALRRAPRTRKARLAAIHHVVGDAARGEHVESRPAAAAPASSQAGEVALMTRSNCRAGQPPEAAVPSSRQRAGAARRKFDRAGRAAVVRCAVGQVQRRRSAAPAVAAATRRVRLRRRRAAGCGALPTSQAEIALQVGVPGRRRRCCRRGCRSRRRLSVFTAPAASARGERRCRRERKPSNLKGTVTFMPRARPAAMKARIASANPSSGASIAS
jgi:hypothetical protein